MNNKNIKIIAFAGLFILCAGIYTYFSYFNTKPTLEKALNHKDLVPVLIVGSGPAGLSAALYTSRAKLPTIVLTGDHPGGTLADVREIENWPGKRKASGENAINDLKAQATKFGTQILNDKVLSINLSSWPFVVKTRDGRTFNVMSLILATGRIAKKLNVPGVEEYWGHGVGVCTICDAPFHKGHNVAVVGGGDTAADRALQLAAFAKKVYMLVKDSELDASGFVQDYVKKNDKIEVLYNTELQEVTGEGDSVTGAKIFNTKTKQASDIAIQGIYFAIGWHPNSDLVQKQVKLQEGDFIWLDGQTQKTSISGFFAAGDVADSLYGKAGVATGSGVKAGMDAIKFMQRLGFEPGTAEKYKDKLAKPEAEKSMELQNINNLAQLKNLVSNETKPIVVDFYTDYCPTCKALMPNLKMLAAQFKDQVLFIKANFDEAQSIVQFYNIPSVPYLALFKNGELVKKTKKIGSKQDIEALVRELLEK
ncbi:MAG: FAD-dependent oxidoreductase [Candidatus Babeliales bacterium]